MHKGKLLIIGGAEDTGDIDQQRKKKQMNREFEKFEILKELLSASRNKKIIVITTGSNIPEAVKKVYLRAFKKIDHADIEFLHIKTKLQAQQKKYLDKIKRAGSIFFSGGDQFRLSTILGGSPMLELIVKRYHQEEDFLIAGTSAGAMVMSAIMLKGGGIEEALFNRDLKLAAGFGLIPNCIIDTHFIKRGRFGRLAHAVITNPGQLGIGLGEDTALIIRKGKEAECHGSGMVVIIDGKRIKNTNIISVSNDQPIYVENLLVHLLVKDCRFSLSSRKLINDS